MKRSFRIGALIFTSGFAALLIIRLIYGYATFDPSGGRAVMLNLIAGEQGGFLNQRVSLSFNKASDKRIVIKDVAGASQKVTVEQKYEKVASLTSETSHFEDDTKAIRQKILSYNAIIQNEQNNGLRGGRTLDLVIGVIPDKFDSFVEEVRTIGTLRSISIDKIDKTSEYRDLRAKRKSLEETIESLIALKKKGGRVEEYIQLENKILEVKKQIQDLGGKLGDYDAENELCTVRLSIGEKNLFTYSFIRSLKISIVWTVKIYAVINLCFAAAMFGLWISVKIADRFNLLKNIRSIGVLKKRKK
jgi:hypothetical protein